MIDAINPGSHDRNRLAGKIAIVVGAGSVGPGWGNGKAAAVVYAREGARVWCIDRSAEAAAETVSIIRSEGNEAEGFTADASASDDIAAAIAACARRWGRIDVLHNNVGIVEVGGPIEISEANWDRLMAVNVKSMFLAAKHALPIMRAQVPNPAGQRGAIVNISSIAAIRYTGYPSISYNASKGAVNQLTQSIAVQYAPDGIRCNAVLPGLMDTPMIREPLKNAYGNGGIEEGLRKRAAASPTGTQGDAWDVAYAALFLASDEAKYVNGHMLVVDGGLSCKMT